MQADIDPRLGKAGRANQLHEPPLSFRARQHRIPRCTQKGAHGLGAPGVGRPPPRRFQVPGVHEVEDECLLVGPLEVPCLDGDGEVDERAGRSGDRKATVHATVSGIEVPRAVGPDAPGTTVAGDHGYVD